MAVVSARSFVVALALTVIIGFVVIASPNPAAVFAFKKSSLTDASNDASAVSTATREGRLAVFDDLWQTVADHYYTDTFHGVDWLAQRSLFRPLAADARGPRELYAELRRMLALLQDAHTRVYAPEEKFDWQHPRFISIGISLREVEGHPTVFTVERGSQAQRAGIRPGDVIETIGGESASALLEKRQREQTSSTPRAAHLQALGALTDGQPETNVEIKWRDAKSREHQASFRRQWRERNFALRAHQLRGGIVVIEIDAFTQALAFELAGTAREKLRHAHGIILDLRSNGGGDATAMAEIASVFLPAATRLGQFTDRQGNVALALETDAMFAGALDRIRRTQIPLVILTSERTSSAAEIFVAALQHAPRVTVVGGQTCGCVLAVRTRHALPDGGELEVSELDYRTAKGVRLEGQGINPDETVGLTRRDLYSHRDRFLESAFARLRSSATR
jgi:carboxyl-terminal processing protease